MMMTLTVKMIRFYVDGCVDIGDDFFPGMGVSRFCRAVPGLVAGRHFGSTN